MTTNKTNLFEVTINNYGKTCFKCKICSRSLASKQNVLKHLHSSHELSPVKRVNKLYVEDASISVPKRTRCRWEKQRKSASKLRSWSNDTSPSIQTEQTIGTSLQNTDATKLMADNYLVCNEDSTCISTNSPFSLEISEESPSFLDKVDCISSNLMDSCNTVKLSTDEDMSDHSCSAYSSCSSDSDSSYSDSSYSDSSCSTEETDNIIPDHPNLTFEAEAEIATVVIKHKLSAAASKDIIKLMKKLSLGSYDIQQISYESLWKECGDVSVKEVHFCSICDSTFPADRNQYMCATENCEGLRYKGTAEAQTRTQRRPRQMFFIAHMQKQLAAFLERPGIWMLIKSRLQQRYLDTGEVIVSDITNGRYYKDLVQNGYLKEEPNMVTATFNTDGISLFKSSKVELWPIFLVINELPPKLRFRRENMLLAGLWQGKGKPHFESYLMEFTDEMNHLFLEGVKIGKPEEAVVKVAVICGVFDLPAKAGVVNMTYYNGANSCITCLEPGYTTKQGKGHARCFPYRNEHDRFDHRKEEDVRIAMNRSTKKKREVGLCGVSGIYEMKSFSFTVGVVPEYMHGILLGITKALLYKWLSPTHSKDPFFVGKKMKDISQRLTSIKPPDFMERLPRNLEGHFSDLKATEYQAWLLYYALPCMSGILPEKYLNHVSVLSEATHILLQETISETELQRAEILLEVFYAQFSELYTAGSCGLNIHNVSHLVYFVRQLGPLWGWSCFAFEDSNSMILHAVHGTGNVLKEVFKFREASQRIHLTKASTICNVMDTVRILGSQQDLPKDDNDQIMKQLGVTCVAQLKKVCRVSIGDQIFYSQCYTRMQKKICHVVLTTTGNICCINYFVVDLQTSCVFAMVSELNMCKEHPLSKLQGGKHLQAVTESLVRNIIPMCYVKEKVFFIKSSDTPDDMFYVARVPNLYGHSVFN